MLYEILQPRFDTDRAAIMLLEVVVGDATMNWDTLRDDFPVTKHWAFLDHAAVAPHSRPAQQALIEWTTDLTENGDVNESRWTRRVEEVRASAGRLLNADPLDIAFI